MRRDWDLIREILLAVENGWDGAWDDAKAERLHHVAPSADAVAYHLRLLIEARLIDAIDRNTTGEDSFIVRRLTWEGHDFLDAARDEPTWKQAKAVVAKETGTLSFDVLKALLINLATRVLIGGAA